eukprot:19469-Hanusia_phi.AAC.1
MPCIGGGSLWRSRLPPTSGARFFRSYRAHSGFAALFAGAQPGAARRYGDASFSYGSLIVPPQPGARGFFGGSLGLE